MLIVQEPMFEYSQIFVTVFVQGNQVIPILGEYNES